MMDFSATRYTTDCSHSWVFINNTDSTSAISGYQRCKYCGLYRPLVLTVIIPGINVMRPIEGSR